MRNISPFLLSKINKQNQTKWENADPKLSVQVSRARTTVMDSTYWTVEIIRTKEGLGDLSTAARRYKPYGGPNKLFNIYVDNGIVKVATRDYPDYQKNKWVDQFSLGSGSAVAIALDGTWELYRKKWQAVTDELPFLFWVNGGILYRQYWDDESTKRELATNVSKVKALRGWKNVNFADRDHGVICAYIKTDGKVYYRNYCLQPDGTMAWENERQLEEFTGTAVNVNLFITNDYRTGFMIENINGYIHWAITKRNWAGMAILPENITVAPGEVEIDYIALDKRLVDIKEYITVAPGTDIKFGAIVNKFIRIQNVPNQDDDWGWIIECDTKEDMVGLELINIAAIDVDKNIPVLFDSLVQTSHRSFTLYASDTIENGFNNVSGCIKIIVSNAINLVGTNIENFDGTFTPDNLIPDETQAPEVEAIWNE